MCGRKRSSPFCEPPHAKRRFLTAGGLVQPAHSGYEPGEYATVSDSFENFLTPCGTRGCGGWFVTFFVDLPAVYVYYIRNVRDERCVGRRRLIGG
jgi:hypothetical protein